MKPDLIVTVRRGTCGLCYERNRRLFPSPDYLVTRIHWLCSTCNIAYNGTGTKDSYYQTYDKLVERRSKLDAWIREIEACME